MFIYADESGHSGRYIFKDSPYYYQGAILSEIDIEPILQPVLNYYYSQLGTQQLHANEIHPGKNVEIANRCMDIMEGINWNFQLTSIEKQYLAPTKFVDTIFDPYENIRVPPHWYEHEFFRHSLCCLFDDILTLNNDQEKFWNSYLKDDFVSLRSIVRRARDRVHFYVNDPRLLKVADEGLAFAENHIEEFTLLANKNKKAYRGHTPNMVAFSSLFNAIHLFCKEYNVKPRAFYHDQQSEFGSSMKEFHQLFSSGLAIEYEQGYLIPTQVDYELGVFSLQSSESMCSLQVVDVFLWLSQRDRSPKIEKFLNRLEQKTNRFNISRKWSEIIVLAWLENLNSKEFSQEDELIANRQIQELNALARKNYDDFLKNQ